MAAPGSIFWDFSQGWSSKDYWIASPAWYTVPDRGPEKGRIIAMSSNKVGTRAPGMNNKISPVVCLLGNNH